ncbi:MASE3 domain-containing protein, partial [Nitrospinota bacterium]
MREGSMDTVQAPSLSVFIGQEVSLTTHTSSQLRWHLVALAIIILILSSVYPFLAISAHQGNTDLHAMIEMVGSLIGLIAGFTIVARFYVLGNRFLLFVGLAFFVNGAEDFAHGYLTFASHHGWIGLPASSLAAFIPGTYVTGRLLMGLILIASPFVPFWFGQSTDTKQETLWVSFVVLGITLVATVLAFQIPLPRFIFPERLISRPVDFLSAVILFIALVIFFREYFREGDMLTWWLMLSIAVNIVGQVMMSFSKSLFDPFFDIAHIYKVLGYAIPLLGFCLFQITLLQESRRARKKLHKAHDELEVQVEERTAGLRVANESLEREITERKEAEKEREKLLHIMGERVKELRCMYEVASAISDRATLEEVFRDVVKFIPHGWHYPEITRAKIRIDGEEYMSEPFEETEWKQSSDIAVDGERRGSVEVFYLEERPELDEGPFLSEERHLIGGIARSLSEATQHKRAEEELRRSQQMVMRAEKLSSIGTLTAGAAHEILNPANIIGLHGQRLLWDSEEGSENHKSGGTIA